MQQQCVWKRNFKKHCETLIAWIIRKLEFACTGAECWCVGGCKISLPQDFFNIWNSSNSVCVCVCVCARAHVSDIWPGMNSKTSLISGTQMGLHQLVSYKHACINLISSETHKTMHIRLSFHLILVNIKFTFKILKLIQILSFYFIQSKRKKTKQKSWMF